MKFDLAKELALLPLEMDASTRRITALCEQAALVEGQAVQVEWAAACLDRCAKARQDALRHAATAMRKVLAPESVDSLIAALLEGQSHATR